MLRRAPSRPPLPHTGIGAGEVLLGSAERTSLLSTGGTPTTASSTDSLYEFDDGSESEDMDGGYYPDTDVTFNGGYNSSTGAPYSIRLIRVQGPDQTHHPAMPEATQWRKASVVSTRREADNSPLLETRGVSPPPNEKKRRANPQKKAEHEAYARSHTSTPLLINDHQAMGLVDTGAEMSVITSGYLQRQGLHRRMKKGGALRLSAADSRIPLDVEGVVELRVTYGSKAPFLHTFAVMDNVNDPRTDVLLGMDILVQMGIRIGGLQMHFPASASIGDTKLSSPEGRGGRPDQGDSTADAKHEYDMYAHDDEMSSAGAYTSTLFSREDQMDTDTLQLILRGIRKALNENEGLSAGFCTHEKSVIYLDTGDAPPVYRRQYPVPRKMLEALYAQVEKWLISGVIEHAEHDSPWNMPLLAVPKRNAAGEIVGIRVCIDARGINLVLQSVEMAIPRIRDLFSSLEGFVIASALDLAAGYNQFEVHVPDRKKLTFTVPGTGKRYSFAGAPFGLKMLTHRFQNVMEMIFMDMRDFVAIYVDDIIVFSRSVEEHVGHLDRVIRRLTSYHLRLKPEKCHFAFRRLRVLGHVLSGTTRAIDHEKLSCLMTYPVPTSGKQVQAFLGFTNYLREYVPLYARLAAPLDKLRQMKRIPPTAWTDECQAAFDGLRTILSQAPVLEFPDERYPYVVATDASQNGIAAVLFQQYGEPPRKHYITFVSRSLTKGQRNYSACRRELLAIIFAFQRLREYLFGYKFELWTDARALTFLHTQKQANYMMQGWMDVLWEYDFSIVHLPGLDNVLADSLSRAFPPHARSRRGRLTLGEGEDGLDTPTVSKTIKAIHLEQEEKVKYTPAQLTSFIKERTGKRLPSPEEQKSLMTQRHLTNHRGHEDLFKKLWADGVYWPTMRADCVNTVASCRDCLRYNIVRRGFHPSKSIHAKYPMDHVCIDLFGPLRTTPRGMNFVLLVTDVATRYTILTAIPNKRAATIARAMWGIITTFGPPKIVQSDNGSEFKNSTMGALTELMGIDSRLTAPYKPQANGLAERHVRSAKDALKKLTSGNLSNWDLFLSSAQMALNTSYQSATKSTPHALMFARPANPLQDYSSVQDRLLTTEELKQRLHEVVCTVYESMDKAAQQRFTARRKALDERRKVKSKPLPVNTIVMLVDQNKGSKMEPHYVGPYRVCKADRNNAYSLISSDGSLLGRKVPFSQMKVVSFPDAGGEAKGEDTEWGFVPDGQFLVDKIMDHKGREGRRQFLIRWKGFDASHDTWEPEGNIHDVKCKGDYWARRAQQQDAKAAKRPRRREAPADANGHRRMKDESEGPPRAAVPRISPAPRAAVVPQGGLRRGTRIRTPKVREDW